MRVSTTMGLILGVCIALFKGAARIAKAPPGDQALGLRHIL